MMLVTIRLFNVYRLENPPSLDVAQYTKLQRACTRNVDQIKSLPQLAVVLSSAAIFKKV